MKIWGIQAKCPGSFKTDGFLVPHNIKLSEKGEEAEFNHHSPWETYVNKHQTSANLKDKISQF